MMTAYEKALRWTLNAKRPQKLLWGLIGLFVVSIVIFNMGSSKVVFFPEGDPAVIYVSIKMPVGTEVEVTDSVTKLVENRVFEVLGKDNPIVESVIANVALGASTDMFNSSTITSNLGKITINFVEFAKRGTKNNPLHR